jgi:Ca2+-transporting ATPase
MSPTLAPDPARSADAGTLSVGDALGLLASSPSGLTSAQVAVRLSEHGPNRIQESAPVPAWRRFASQFTNFLTLILIGAAAVSFLVSGEIKTPAVVILVVLVNAVIGFVQENRAEASLAALRRMLAVSARVRRDGTLTNVPTDAIVPGDIVLVEAGDRIPADCRVIAATGLEVEEAALTGESQPVVKDVSPHAPGVPLGDRHCSVFMNTTVTRGRGEILVTATGMSTEIGRIADLLRSTETEKSPLQRQLDRLAHNLTYLAGGIVALVAAIGLISGDSLSKVLLTAVALAVASIPEGLPAVTAVTLAIGVARMAERNAIIKRLSSVETLGCTNVICSDKTGTLTLNQMTAVELVHMNQPHEVSGDGYSPEGRIEAARGDDPVAMANALSGMALCNDAVVSRTADGTWELVGDPTEGALTVLAMKGGIHIEDLRHARPRVAEVPFDSAHKYMATFHRMVTDEGHEIVRAWVKGAPDVLLALSSRAIDGDGAAAALDEVRGELLAHNERLGERGLRVLALAQRDFGIEEWGELHGTDPMELIDRLTLVALVGIIDPARPEARDAITQAAWAGIDVKMITGDHAVTATTIARELGLDGETVTGAELDAMSDEDLDRRIDGISVFARVTPTHKMRLVARLQGRGNIVAMTGDGVNDAPALKKADIGVAMGITGTEVTKEAATMVLTDDNFATIVGAVERGRIIYDNIVKFVRFQLSTTLGFAVVFLAASVLDIANRKPFAAIAILWVNIIMDGPPAMALGVDPGSRDVMTRRPRPLDEPILTARRWSAVLLSAVVMATGTLAVLHWAPGPEALAGEATVAGTMGFATFVLFQFFNILNVRSETDTVFSRATLTNRSLWIALGAVVSLQVAVTHVGPLQRLFDTVDMTAGQWLVAVAVASSVLWAEEARKILVRHRARP